jgi:hypothetical protein
MYRIQALKKEIEGNRKRCNEPQILNNPQEANNTLGDIMKIKQSVGLFYLFICLFFFFFYFLFLTLFLFKRKTARRS